jgi:hypothetical protein
MWQIVKVDCPEPVTLYPEREDHGEAVIVWKSLFKLWIVHKHVHVARSDLTDQTSLVLIEERLLVDRLAKLLGSISIPRTGRISTRWYLSCANTLCDDGVENSSH